MAKIKVINGIYGLRVSEALVEPKTVNDADFEVDNKEAERLVGLGIAEYVNEADHKEVDPDTEEVAPVQQECSEGNATDAEIAPHTEALYSENMKLDELKKIAIDSGASKAKVKKMRTKKEVMSAIDAAVEKANAKQESLPEIGAADFE